MSKNGQSSVYYDNDTCGTQMGLQNMYIGRSTLEDYESLRIPKKGTPYIQAICQALEKEWMTHSLRDIFTGSVASEMKSVNVPGYNHAQIPEWSATGCICHQMKWTLYKTLIYHVEPKPNSLLFHEKKEEIYKILDLSIASNGFFFGEDVKITKNEHIEGLDFVKISPSKFSEVPFFVAEDSFGDVYIVYTVNHSSDKRNLLLKCQLASLGLKKEGKFHNGYLEVAEQFPFETIFSIERYFDHF